MIHIEQSILVKCSVEEGFAFAANPENDPKWWSKVLEDKLLTAGPIQKGARFREIAK